jgi:hypothetical protein
VDDPGPVRGIQPARHLGDPVSSPLRRDPVLLTEQVPDRPALEQLHDHEPALLGVEDVEDSDDVGVGEARGQPGLAQEAGLGLRRVVAAGQRGIQLFQGDHPGEALVVRAVDHPHAAAAKLRLEPVAGTDDLRQPQSQRLGGRSL